MAIPAPAPTPAGPAAPPPEDVVDITLSLPRSQLATAYEVISQFAAILQEAQAQADAPMAPPGGGEAPPVEGGSADNSPQGLLASLQGM